MGHVTGVLFPCFSVNECTERSQASQHMEKANHCLMQVLHTHFLQKTISITNPDQRGVADDVLGQEFKGCTCCSVQLCRKIAVHVHGIAWLSRQGGERNHMPVAILQANNMTAGLASILFSPER